MKPADVVLSVLLWTSFFLIHSLLAAAEVKSWVKQNCSKLFHLYRILYNIIALATFTMALAVTRHLNDRSIATLPEWLVISGWILLIVGVLIISITFRTYSFREFAGFENEFVHKPELTTIGLNAYVRHPIYLGTLILLLGYLLSVFTFQTFIFVIVSTVYLFIGSWIEERKLIKEFGEKYTRYKENVPGIIPWSIKKRKRSDF